MAAERERTEDEPLVGRTASVAHQQTADSSRPWLWPVFRSRIFRAVALGTLGLAVLAMIVSGVHGRGKHHRAVPGDEADASAFTGLDVLGDGIVRLQVGTSSQAFAETASSVDVAFLVGGVWTVDQELFKSSQEGQVHVVSAMASEWPSAVRMRINGNDGWGYKFIRISFADTTQSLLESADGEPYGDNEFWLDGDQKLQSERVLPVPPHPTRRGVTRRSNHARWVLLLLLVLLVVGVTAYLFRDVIYRSLAPSPANLNGQGPALQAPIASHQEFLMTGPMVHPR
uniref:Uncharacterized protein n=1 Tax=Alexandrium monilatum TaxID=311494 RepID=A0A7S4SIQ7_9DINO|mmetsp:Transcript_24027/g.71860  ORF Transcript_24027/g.71860 Transcript_24027/m.71860 type:complete len:285 (+) Transcript_24027:83-937(+)